MLGASSMETSQRRVESGASERGKRIGNPTADSTGFLYCDRRTERPGQKKAFGEAAVTLRIIDMANVGLTVVRAKDGISFCINCLSDCPFLTPFSTDRYNA